VVEIVAYLKNEMEKGAFSLFHLADLSPWQPKKFSIFGNEQKRKNEQKKKLFSTSSFLFSSFFFNSHTTGLVSSVIMLAAVNSGDAKKVAEMIRQDPGFKVNMAVDGDRNTLLHHACWESHNRSAVILPLLLAHPDIDVNVKDKYGATPFFLACGGHVSCVREMLKDSRVKVNERAQK